METPVRGQNGSSWWTTLPGLLTALAAIITAVTGLVLALNQIGLFGSSSQDSSSTAPREGAAPATGDGPAGAAGHAATMPPGGGTYEATLPLNQPMRSGDVTYEIVGYEIRPDSDDTLALSLDIRMTNHGRFDANFWDASFRLAAGKDTIAPSGGLNEVVAGDASKVGSVLFVIPDTTRSAALKIKFDEGDRTVPFELQPVRS